jgi:hypothetical protein
MTQERTIHAGPDEQASQRILEDALRTLRTLEEQIYEPRKLTRVNIGSCQRRHSETRELPGRQ